MIEKQNISKDNLLDAHDILADTRKRVSLSGIMSYDTGRREYIYRSNLPDRQFSTIWSNIKTRWDDEIWVSILVNCFSKNKRIWYDDYILHVPSEIRKILEKK